MVRQLFSPPLSDPSSGHQIQLTLLPELPSGTPLSLLPFPEDRPVSLTVLPQVTTEALTEGSATGPRQALTCGPSLTSCHPHLLRNSEAHLHLH